MTMSRKQAADQAAFKNAMRDGRTYWVEGDKKRGFSVASRLLTEDLNRPAAWRQP